MPECRGAVVGIPFLGADSSESLPILVRAGRFPWCEIDLQTRLRGQRVWMEGGVE
jgi:hypothetical protein